MNLFEDADPTAEVLSFGEKEWVDLEFEVALDTGSIVHICAEEDTPGYTLEGVRMGTRLISVYEAGRTGRKLSRLAKLAGTSCASETLLKEEHLQHGGPEAFSWAWIRKTTHTSSLTTVALRRLALWLDSPMLENGTWTR